MAARSTTTPGRVLRRVAVAIAAAGLAVAGAAASPAGAAEPIDPPRPSSVSSGGEGGEDQPSTEQPPLPDTGGRGTIHPGVMMFTDGAQCTANFIFSSGDRRFIGYAAHCASENPQSIDGCVTPALPLGTPVRIGGAEFPGTLAYSSWGTMQQNGEVVGSDICLFNDFALVEIDPRDLDRVNPTVPFFGGPTGLDTDGTERGERVFSYQNSGLRPGALLDPKFGQSFGDMAAGLTHTVFTVTPGIFGDSGSGYLDRDGEAFGVLSTISFPTLTNGVTDLNNALIYANSDSVGEVLLVEGTAPFRLSTVAVPPQPALPPSP